MTVDVTLRPLLRADLALLGTWLAEPLVSRWWNHETAPEALDRDFGPSVDGRDATELLVVLADGRAVGMVQRYPIHAYPEYVEELEPICDVPPGALGIDYLVGDPAARGRGVGAGAIAAVVADGWLRHPSARDVLVPVVAGNTASWRALERAGFTRVASGPLSPDNPADPPDHHVYRLRRPGGG